MKKTLKFLSLFAVVAVVSLTLNITASDACFRCADGSLGDTDLEDSCPVPVVEEAALEVPAPVYGSYCIDCFKPSIKYFTAEVVGNEVRTTFLTTQVMNAYVAYTNGDAVGTSQYEMGTGHNITFTIPENGTFTITPQADYQGKTIIGQSVEVVITGNEAAVVDSEAVKMPTFRGGLLQEQIEGLLDLFYGKDMSDWTKTDWSNWEWAVIE